MPARKKPTAPKKNTSIMIEAALSPANAAEQRNDVLAAMDAARKSNTALAIGMKGEEASPCALQILIAATRSARKHDLSLELTAEAKSALADINLD